MAPGAGSRRVLERHWVGSGAGEEPQSGPQLMRSPLGAQNQTLQRLQRVLHADPAPCLPHLLSRLCRDLGPGALRMAARMYLQKGRCWWWGAPRVVPWGWAG